MAFWDKNQPTPPNPIATAAAQTGTNVSTGVANAFLNNVNQVTPQGNLIYSTDPNDPAQNYNWTDPVTNVTYKIPRFTATQQETTPQHEIRWRNEAAQFNLANAAKQGSWDIWHMLEDQPIDPNAAGVPQAGDPNSIRMPDAATTYGGNMPIRSSLGNYGQQRMQLDPITGMPISNTFGGTGQGVMYDYGSGGWGGPISGFGDAGSQQIGFGDAGNITRSYGPADNFSADRRRVEGALYDRLQPQLERDRANLEQRLADQGIRYGSAAYNQAMDDYNRQSTDARLAVTAQGGQEQQRMMDMAAKEAGFENSAQQQAYEQAQGRGAFANTAQQKIFEQAQARGQFYNTAQQQAVTQAQQRGQFANAAQAQEFTQAAARGEFANKAREQQFQELLDSGKFENAAQAQQFLEMQQAGQFENAAQQQDYTQAALRAQFGNQGLAQTMAQRQAAFDAAQAARSTKLNETYAARNQRFNEINALMSGSQVSQPNFVNTGRNNIATTDVAGLINTNFNQNLSNYQQSSQNFNQLMGGIFGGLAGLVKSDEREKENIHKVASIFAVGPDDEGELPIYRYSYKDDPASTRHIGPMAQDVERLDRGSVVSIRGVKHINVPRMGSILKAA